MSEPRQEELQEQIRRLTEELLAAKEEKTSLLKEREGMLQERERMLQERMRMLRENALLRQKLDALARRLFGRSSEQLDENQLLLLLQEAESPGPAMGNESSPEEIETETPRRKKVAQKPRAARIPEHLPVTEEVIVPDAVKATPQDWRRIGEEVSEVLDYEPARFIRRRTVRPKYVHRKQIDAVPVIAPLPESLQERCIAAPGLIAQILVGKYADHLPLYRQESIYWSRHGVWLPRQSLARWVGLAAEWLKPIYEAIRTGVMGGGYVQIDETPVKYLEPGHGQTKQGYLWACHRPGSDVVFHWETSRAASCLDTIVPVDFSGTIQCDGYSAYAAFAKRRSEAITLAGCWAHVRRAFYEARREAPQLMGWILIQIRALYAIEMRLRKQKAGPRLRQAIRCSQSQPIIKRIRKALTSWKLGRRFLPNSLAGKAIDYALSQWTAVCEYLGDGRVEICNNLVENAIRPTAIGKKNWMFFGDADAGERSAIIYTIIESCRRRGIDPYAYLRDVLTRLPKATNWQIRVLTPEAWAKARAIISLPRAA
jgi:transposase